MPRLSLYGYDSCFYCRRVKQAITRLGLSGIEDRNVLAQPAYRQELLRVLGRRTVPVLRIDHEDGRIEWLPESRDIIRWLADNAAARDAAPG